MKERSRRLDILLSGNNVPGDSGASMDIKPEWFDEEMFEQGRQLSLEHLYIFIFGSVLGTQMLSQNHGLMEPLVTTGSANSVEATQRRAINTLESGLLWMEGNFWDKKDEAYKNMRKVRKIHLIIAKQMNTKIVKPGGGLWLSQLDMALTQFSIIGPVILYPDKLGNYLSEKEMDSLLFFWRCMGHQLGMIDEYNLFRGRYKVNRTKTAYYYLKNK